MHPDWLIVVNLGSFAMIGVGLLFVVLWGIDRSRIHVLWFAGSIALNLAGTLVLSIDADPALTSSIHGILLPVSFLLLADGLLRRSGQRMGWGAAAAFVVVLAAMVWYFAYVAPLLIGRVVTQNLGLGILATVTAARLMTSARTTPDRVTVIATATLAVSLLLNVGLAAISDVPDAITSDADMERYLATPLEAGLIVASAVILPALTVVLLAVTFLDVVGDLRFQRDRDQLTGLLNRRGFTEQAEHALKHSPGSALILADLDYFKEVNDALGHAGGDFALETFAAVLRTAGGHGQIAGRVGGEEFAVLMPNTGSGRAVEYAESIRARLAGCSVSYGGASASVTASFGVATGSPTTSLQALFDEADRALYDAKARGRNCTAMLE